MDENQIYEQISRLPGEGRIGAIEAIPRPATGGYWWIIRAEYQVEPCDCCGRATWLSASGSGGTMADALSRAVDRAIDDSRGHYLGTQ